MKFESKYNLNQRVWSIGRRPDNKTVKCEACNGIGKITLLNNKETHCPECYGRCTNTIYGVTKWFVSDESYKIGQCRAEITSFKKTGCFDNIGEYNPEKMEKLYQYMCYETGIGSGSIHDEDTIYPTKEEAQAECDKRNLAGTGD